MIKNENSYLFRINNCVFNVLQAKSNNFNHTHYNLFNNIKGELNTYADPIAAIDRLIRR